MLLKVISTGSKQGNCYALCSDDGEILILDCGCRFKDILRGINYRIANVSGVLLTHVHKDHSKSFEDFMTHGIYVYTNYETQEHFEISTGEKMVGKPEKIAFRVGGFAVTPFYLPHTSMDAETGMLMPCPNYGYYINHAEMGSLVYMTDYEYPTLSFRTARVNHILSEVNYMDELAEREEAQYAHRLKGHLSLNTFIEKVLKQNITASLRTVTVCHLSDSDSDEREILWRIKETAGENVICNIARPGLEIELNKYPF